MSDSAPLGNLPIYNARTWTTGESMTRTKFQSEFDQAEALLTLCKTALADIQNRRHGSSSPTENAIAGQIWAKKISAARTQWFGDPDGAGADDQFLTEGEAYNADNKTAGTGTFKAGGAVDVDTATAGTFTVPANTLNADGDLLYMMGHEGTGSTLMRLSFGGSQLAQLTSVAAAVVAGFIVVRTGGGAQKWVGFSRLASDATGGTALVKTGTSAVDETSGALIVMQNDNGAGGLSAIDDHILRFR